MLNEMKKEFILEGLDCANCAAKIEDNVGKINGVSSSTLNFMTKTLSIETEKGENFENIFAEAVSIIRKLEPDVKINEKEVTKYILDGRNEDEKAGLGSLPLKDIKVIRISAGAILFIIGLILKFPFWVEFGVFFTSYLLVGGDVILKAIRNISKGQVFDENFLMGIATVGAFAIKEFPEGVAVMLFYQIGEFFQELAVNRSRKSISSLMDIRPDYANLKIGDEVKRVSPYDVKIGDIIIIKPGEKIPLDGKVINGKSMVDTSALTGESVLREVEAGNDLLSGSVNKNGVLTVEVVKEFGESTVSKILELVQNAGSKKSPTENFITKFARYYTPVVVFTALALAFIPPLLIPGVGFTQWINRALVFLVVSCPCALVISIPLGFFGGIGGASKKGILIKGSCYLEAMNKIETVVFDKTGTLTKGVFNVTKVNCSICQPDIDILEYAAYAESFSNHPIAVSILRRYGKEIDKNKIADYEEISGHGIKVRIKGKLVLCGNEKLMKSQGISYEVPAETGTVVHVAIDGEYAGNIVISDVIKEDSKKAIMELKKIGVKNLVMLTGDNKNISEKIGSELGLDEVHSELLPHQKVEELEILYKNNPGKGKLIFVGDGINDAPVLARADVGVAMGGVGSDAAIEAADVVLMTDEPTKLVSAIKIAKRVRNIVWQNIIFALAIKGIVLLLGAGGLANMWEAVFADVGVALIAVLNAMRAMKVEN